MKFILTTLMFLGLPLTMINTAYSEAAFPVLKGPYFGQTPPGSTPKVFAPGIVSVDGRYEYGVSFSPDFTEMYYSPSIDGKSAVYFSHLKNNKWTKPRAANFTKGKASDEFSASVSADGSKVYFTTYDKKHPLKIWYVSRTKNTWSDAQLLNTPVNKDEVININEGKNGDLYYINSSKAKMYYAPRLNGKLVKGRELEIEYGSHAFVSPEQDYLVAAANRDNDTSLDKDIYVYFKNSDGAWSSPINLGSPVNSSFREGSPTITPDGKYLFFNRYDEENGNPNIYWVSTDIIYRLKQIFLKSDKAL